MTPLGSALSCFWPLDQQAMDLTTAFSHLHSGRPAEAVRLCDGLLGRNPDDPDALHCRGLALAQLGESARARSDLSRAVALRPGDPHLLHNYGFLLLRLGEAATAVTAFERAAGLTPGEAQMHLSFGNALATLGQFERAEASFRRAVQLRPDWVEAHLNLARAQRDQRRDGEAIDSLRRAVALRPDRADLHFQLGEVLLSAGRPLDALAALRAAVEGKPGWPEARYQIAVALAGIEQFEAATETYRGLLAEFPDHVECLNGLAAALLRLGQQQKNCTHLREATRALERVVALRPNDPDALSALATAPLRTGLASQAEAVRLLERARALRPDNRKVCQALLFNRLYRAELTPAVWKDELESFAHACFPEPVQPPARPPQGERLRIGYVSPDFRNHSCAWFIEPLLAAHDRRRFEVFCYSCTPVVDGVTRRLQALADHWHDLTTLDDAEAARRIRDHGIDILVDLAGHTGDNRLGIFARKPAPVQATWLGCPASTGLAAVDFRLSDPWLTPADTPEHYAERLWNLERVSHCWQPAPDSPPVVPPPALLCGQITFGSFNNLLKLTPETAQLWARVLQAVPGSRLVLKSWPLDDPGVRAEVIGHFVQLGICADRLALLGSRSEHADHLSCYHSVDIALDPWPYNGATTTLEALWMGVPVVSRTGWQTASRYGAALLSAVGLDHLVAHSPDEFVEIACRLATDLPALASLRRELRPRLAASPLCDSVDFARALERAYLRMVALTVSMHKGAEKS